MIDTTIPSGDGSHVVPILICSEPHRIGFDTKTYDESYYTALLKNWCEEYIKDAAWSIDISEDYGVATFQFEEDAMKFKRWWL